MLGAIKYGLSNLANFNGRDALETFWYFVLAVYVAFTAVSMAAIGPVMEGMFAGAFDAARSGASQAATNQAMMRQMSSMFGSIGWTSVATGVGMMLLLAASFARRLHDSGLSGWWAAAPGAIYAYAISQIPAQMESMEASLTNPEIVYAQNPFAMFQVMGWQWLVGWIPLVMVIALGVRKSTKGPNAYGAEPVRF